MIFWSKQFFREILLSVIYDCLLYLLEGGNILKSSIFKLRMVSSLTWENCQAKGSSKMHLTFDSFLFNIGNSRWYILFSFSVWKASLWEILSVFSFFRKQKCFEGGGVKRRLKETDNFSSFSTGRKSIFAAPWHPTIYRRISENVRKCRKKLENVRSGSSKSNDISLLS